MIRSNVLVRLCPRGELARRPLLILAAMALLSGCEMAAYGTDGSAPGAISNGFGSPMSEPACSSVNYDSYLGEIGVAGAQSSIYEPPQNGSGLDRLDYHTQAEYDYALGDGAGAGYFYFMGGPQYAPSNETPYQWGISQGEAALAYIDEAYFITPLSHFPYVTADVEGYSPGQHGWNEPASGQALTNNQQTYQGFVDFLQGNGVNVGVYSDPNVWQNVMGNEHVYQVEWTSSTELQSEAVTPCPDRFTNGPSGITATFFGGATEDTNNAIMWQWSGGSADYDSMALDHLDAVFNLSLVP